MTAVEISGWSLVCELGVCYLIHVFTGNTRYLNGFSLLCHVC